MEPTLIKLSSRPGSPITKVYPFNLNIFTMKTTTLKISFIFLFLGLMGAGCEKEEDVYQSTLNGKWILLGFGDDATNEFSPEPESESKSSYMIFDNGKMKQRS